jgi:hypothetical protein
MSQFVPVVANGRFFCLDMGNWSVLLGGGFALAAGRGERPNATASVTGGFRVPPKRGHNQQERGP